ncbi:sensor histidine kinase [Prauserella alba]|uniref:histidine kinase n=1 Tax=Prauserella alba TaxID=176898 RepID=A0ABP4FT14_9PSEU|nr:nitrate- and nitrite sensing domain-containing protein [Prauserella alba]MCP2181484.1 Signal transduction histidine kinase [Prauserella alba]
MPRRSQAPRDEAADIQRSGGRWRLRNWRLRTRLLAALLVPVLAMLGFAGLRVESNLAEAGDYAAATERVRVDDTVANLVHELQRERDLTVRYVAGGRQGRPVEVLRQRERVDTARGEFEKTLTAARPDLPDEAVEDFRQWERGLEGLAAARYAGQHSAQPAGQVLAAYNDRVAGLLDMGGQAAVDTSDRELASTYLAAGSLARVKDALSIRRALVGEALASGTASPALRRALSGADVQVADARNNHAKFATPAQRRLLDEELNPRVEATSGTVTAVLNGDLSADPATWDRQATHAVDAAKRAEDALRDDVRDRSAALASEARSDALIDGTVILGVLLLAGLLAMAITRSLLRPLRTLRNSALDVAHYRLPEAVKGILADPDPRPEDAHRRSVEPVRVYSREELGQVARAFDAVHGQAVRLAGEQAMLRENVSSMFVNLSRRSQDLVERQLTVLDRMEEHEQDPDVLGGLFELDHLATRMRRNSENLLVLAGQDVGRPLPGAVAAEEIIGAALSEVEHYQRINVATTPQIGVRGEIVGDLVHVISELFENATDYSPGDSPVSVVSAVTQDGEWRIDITDRGAGMPETEIHRANMRLAEVPDVDVEVSRRMGLYVVARLARQHDIRVWLSAADLMGLTATVVVPAALVRQADSSPQESPVALEEATTTGQQSGQERPSSVVFRPEPQRRPATALPAEPEPSEPLAAADEPEDGPASAPVGRPVPDGGPRREAVAELFTDPYAEAGTFGVPARMPEQAPFAEPDAVGHPEAVASDDAVEPEDAPEPEDTVVPEDMAEPEDAVEPEVTAQAHATARGGEAEPSGSANLGPVLPRRMPAVSEVLADESGDTGDAGATDFADHPVQADGVEQVAGPAAPTGNQDPRFQDVGSQDAGSQETRSQETRHQETRSRDAQSPDAASPDAQYGDSRYGDLQQDQPRYEAPQHEPAFGEGVRGAEPEHGRAGRGGSAEQPASLRRPVRRPGAVPAADESLTEEIPLVPGGAETGRAAAFGTREADWEDDRDVASAARPPVPESAAEVTDGLTAPVPVIEDPDADRDGERAAAVDDVAADGAQDVPALGRAPAATGTDAPATSGADRETAVGPTAEPAPGRGARRRREPDLEPAEQTDVSAWGPGPTWPMRDDDEPGATPQPQPTSGSVPAPGDSAEAALGDDAPTDRMAAYRRLMTRWFEPGGDPQDWLLDSAEQGGAVPDRAEYVGAEYDNAQYTGAEYARADRGGSTTGPAGARPNGSDHGEWHRRGGTPEAVRNGDVRSQPPGPGGGSAVTGSSGTVPESTVPDGPVQQGAGSEDALPGHSDPDPALEPERGDLAPEVPGHDGRADRNGAASTGSEPVGSADDDVEAGVRNGYGTDGGRRRRQPAFIDRSPEAIRERMSGLQRATALARHGRSR